MSNRIQFALSKLIFWKLFDILGCLLIHRHPTFYNIFLIKKSWFHNKYITISQWIFFSVREKCKTSGVCDSIEYAVNCLLFTIALRCIIHNMHVRIRWPITGSRELVLLPVIQRRLNSIQAFIYYYRITKLIYLELTLSLFQYRYQCR